VCREVDEVFIGEREADYSCQMDHCGHASGWRSKSLERVVGRYAGR
jgi:hypothetical protein